MFYHLLEQTSDAVGIFGVILLLLAFYLLNINKLSPQHLKYQLLNFFGAWLILYSLFFHWNTASALIEVVWIIISMIGIYNAVKKGLNNNIR